MYHRVGEEAAFPSTSVSMEQFEAHVSMLEKQKYTVWPLEKLINAFKTGQDIPDRTMAITFDDAYRSVYAIAWPRLKRAGMPFTLFVGTNSVDIGAAGFMSWDQLREMAAAGVTIGNHTDTHPHMGRRDFGAKQRGNTPRAPPARRRTFGNTEIIRLSLRRDEQRSP